MTVIWSEGPRTSRRGAEPHLHVGRLQKQLETQFEELKKLEGMRGSLTHVIVHGTVA